MIEFEDVQDLVSPVLIAAFEGWNDAGRRRLRGGRPPPRACGTPQVVGAIDPEDFYDFQVNRPIVGTDDDGHRRITWPSTQLVVARPPSSTAT